MDYHAAREYFLQKPEAKEDFPFRPDIAVFKIRGKMFATLVAEDDGARCNLKCQPDEAQMLRDVFDAVMPGYHMNKRHWNTVRLDGTIPFGELARMVDNSYALVVGKMTRAERQSLVTLHGREAIFASVS